MEFPKELTDSLRSGRVIPFVGAGVSMAVKSRETGERLFPSWKQLLERAAARLDEEGKAPNATIVRSLLEIDTPEYLEAARRARDGLGAVWFKFLKEELGRTREEVEDESLSLPKLVWDLGSQLLITSNYDRVLNWSCPRSDDLNIWDIQAPAEQSAALRERIAHPTVWHLHGQIGNAARLILTPDGYNRLYPEAGDLDVQYRAALDTLRSFMVSHTLLFIGFSLDDMYFGMQLRGVDQIFEGATGPHYVLVREADKERVKSLSLPVQLVTFKDLGPPHLEVLSHLAKIASEGASALLESEPENIVRTALVATYNPRNPVFYVPYRSKGDQVIGREETIQAVRDQLTAGRRTAIGQTAAFEGLGGLGKTQLAVEYAYRYRDEYPNGVIWINADQDIDAQLASLAEKARWIAPESEHKYKLEIAEHRLRTYSDCLVVFDNVESLAAITNYLPEPQANPHILVTSRTEQLGFTPIPLDLLGDELSLELLLQEAGPIQQPTERADWDASREIAKALEGLPLALELAGAYVRYRRLRWQSYRDLLGQNLKAALPGKFLGGSFTRHEKDIYSTLKINEEVFAEEPLLRQILNLLTWSGSAPMGLSLMHALLNVGNAAELTGAISLGTALRLLHKSAKTESYAIHRLVREVRREEVPLEGWEVTVNDVCQRIGQWFQERRENFEDLPYFEAEIDHLRAWQAHALKCSRKQASRLTWLQGYPPVARGRYDEGKLCIDQALYLFEEEGSGGRELEAHLLSDLGGYYLFSGDYRASLEYGKRALTIRQDLFGEQHNDTARSLSQIGVVCRTLGDNKSAVEFAARALAIRVGLFGERHRETVTALNDVATSFRSVGDQKQALQSAQKALDISEQLFGEQHTHTAMSLGALGAVYIAQGDHRLASECGERALRIWRQLFGERHPSVTGALHLASTAYAFLGNHQRALDYAKRSLDISLELFGERNPLLAGILENVGGVYVLLNDHKHALDYLEKALKLRREKIGEGHPDTALSALLLAFALWNSGRGSEAFQLVSEMLRNLPKDHPHYDQVRFVEQQLSAKTLRPGFRQPSIGKQKNKRKRNRKKGDR